MPGQISAVEAISPAFTRTKRMLFQPFRFGLWSRLAVVALITGEAGGGGGGGGSLPNMNTGGGGGGRGGDQWRAVAHLFSQPRWEELQPYIFWIIAGVAAVLALFFLWVYCDCVYRFILLDTVVTGKCQLREGWRKWRENGRQYFVWVLGFGFCSVLLLGIVAGVPIWLAWRAGWLQKMENHIGGLIGGGLLLGLFLVVLFLALAVIDLFARDFVIPVMAFENVDSVEGWRRLWGMMRLDKAAYIVYVLMKVVLAVGGTIVFAIANFVVILVLLIPVGLLGLIGFLVGRGMGLDWNNVSVVLILAALGLLALAGLLYVVGFVYAPGLVFFQSYTLEFFAARYGPLRSRMTANAPPVASPITPIAPQAPPMPPPLLPGDAFPA